MRLDCDSCLGMLGHHIIEHLGAEHFLALIVSQQPQPRRLVISVISDGDVIPSATLNTFLFWSIFLLSEHIIIFITLVIDVSDFIIFIFLLFVFRTIDVSNLCRGSGLCHHPTIIILSLIDRILIGQLSGTMSAWHISCDQKLLILGQIGVTFRSVGA